MAASVRSCLLKLAQKVSRDPSLQTELSHLPTVFSGGGAEELQVVVDDPEGKRCSACALEAALAAIAPVLA
eukprot:6196610-Pleurochrysis_carterae.AAC.1